LHHKAEEGTETCKKKPTKLSGHLYIESEHIANLSTK